MTGSEERPEIRTERRGRSLWIWIDREERRNAINKRVIQGIERAVIESQQDEVLRGIVLTGVGRKAFCAGADLTGGTSTFTRGLGRADDGFRQARPRYPQHRRAADWPN